MAANDDEGENILFRVEAALKNSRICLLLGSKGLGKTTLAHRMYERHQKNSLCAFIDGQKISLSPENFSVEFIGSIWWAALRRPKNEFSSFLSLDFLMQKKSELSDEAFSCIEGVHNELLKIKPDHRALLRHALFFPDALGRQLKKNSLVIIDNAEQLLELNNFSAIEDVSSFFKESSAHFLLTSFASQEMIKAFGLAVPIHLGPLSAQHAQELTKEKFPHLDKDTFEELYRLSRGHPFVISALAHKASHTKHLTKAFYNDLLHHQGLLYRHCADAIEHSLLRARGQTLPRVILKVVSQEELRLSEIARKIYRSAPVTKILLERLIEVSLLKKEGKTFSFCDPLLGLWVKLISKGFECRDELTDEQLAEVLKL